MGSLGVVEPEPVSLLRVRTWLPCSESLTEAAALLDILPCAQENESSAVVDHYFVRSKFVLGDEGEEAYGCEVKHSCFDPLRVDNLPVGCQVELEVCAVNSVGCSPPVAIIVQIPSLRKNLDMNSVAAETEEAVASEKFERELHTDRRQSFDVLEEQVCRLSAAEAAHETQQRKLHEELLQERELFEHERNNQMASAAAQTAEIAAQWAMLEQRQADLKTQEDSAAVHFSQLPERLELEEHQQELWRRQVELEEENRTREECWRDRNHRLEQSSQAELARERHERDECGRQLAKQLLEAEQATQTAEKAQERQAALEARVQDLSAAESKAEAATKAAAEVEVTEELQKRMREGLVRDREEFERERSEQQAIANARAEEFAAQKHMLEQQHAESEAQEHDAAARLSRLEVLEQHQQVLMSEQIEFLKEHRAGEEEWEEESLKFKQRAEELAVQEAALRMERKELHTTRENLAVVQAHVLSMLEQTRPVREVSTHRLDAVDVPEAADDAVVDNAVTFDKMWSMDWTAVEDTKRT